MDTFGINHCSYYHYCDRYAVLIEFLVVIYVCNGYCSCLVLSTVSSDFCLNKVQEERKRKYCLNEILFSGEISWQGKLIHAILVKEAYLTGHKLAMDKAREASDKTNAEEKENLLHEALSLDGFACHFLTDSFSSGHIRYKSLFLLSLL